MLSGKVVTPIVTDNIWCPGYHILLIMYGFTVFRKLVTRYNEIVVHFPWGNFGHYLFFTLIPIHLELYNIQSMAELIKLGLTTIH